MARTRESGRGGARTPANPAPVSGPGRLARRTDGGPSQPVRSFPAEFQGQRQQLRQQQQAAPLPVAGGNPMSGQGGPRPQPAQPLSVFGPTQRPNEPIQAGIPFGPGPGGVMQGAHDTVMLLQQMAAVWPSPALLRLISLAAEERDMQGMTSGQQ